MYCKHPAECLIQSKIQRHLDSCRFHVPEGASCENCRHRVTHSIFDPYPACYKHEMGTFSNHGCDLFQRGKPLEQVVNTKHYQPEINEERALMRRSLGDCFNLCQKNMAHRSASSEEEESFYWSCALGTRDSVLLAKAVLNRLQPEKSGCLLDLPTRWTGKLKRCLETPARVLIENSEMDLESFRQSDEYPWKLADYGFAAEDRFWEAAAFQALLYDFCNNLSEDANLRFFLLQSFMNSLLECPLEPRLYEQGHLVAVRMKSLIPLFEHNGEPDLRGAYWMVHTYRARCHKALGQTHDAFDAYLEAAAHATKPEGYLGDLCSAATVMMAAERYDNALLALEQGKAVAAGLGPCMDLASWEYYYFFALFNMGFDPAKDDYKARSPELQAFMTLLGNMDDHYYHRDQLMELVPVLDNIIDDDLEIQKELENTTMGGRQSRLTRGELELDRLFHRLLLCYRDPDRSRSLIQQIKQIDRECLTRKQASALAFYQGLELLRGDNPIEAYLYFERHAHQWNDLDSNMLTHLLWGRLMATAIYLRTRQEEDEELKERLRVLSRTIREEMEQTANGNALYLRRLVAQDAVQWAIVAIGMYLGVIRGPVFWLRQPSVSEAFAQQLLLELWDLLVPMMTMGAHGACSHSATTKRVVVFQHALTVYVRMGALIHKRFALKIITPEGHADQAGLLAEKMAAEHKREQKLEQSYLAFKKAEIMDYRSVKVQLPKGGPHPKALSLCIFASTPMEGEQFFVSLGYYRGRARLVSMGSMSETQKMIERWITVESDIFLGDEVIRDNRYTEDLSNLFLAGLADLEPPPMGTELFLILESPLTAMTWDLLQYRGARLGARFQIAILMKQSPDLQPVSMDRGLLILADPRCPERFANPDLEGTRMEAKKIAARFGKNAITLLGREATPKALAERLRQRQPSVLHLACHIFSNTSYPEACMLFLGSHDGRDESAILSYNQILTLPLEQVDLVVLSCCKSGEGRHRRGFGIDGVAQAFLRAGASHVVAGRWNTIDGKALAFMEQFYSQLEHDNPMEALYQTKNHFFRALDRNPGRPPLEESEIANWMYFS